MRTFIIVTYTLMAVIHAVELALTTQSVTGRVFDAAFFAIGVLGVVWVVVKKPDLGPRPIKSTTLGLSESAQTADRR